MLSRAVTAIVSVAGSGIQPVLDPQVMTMRTIGTEIQDLLDALTVEVELKLLGSSDRSCQVWEFFDEGREVVADVGLPVGLAEAAQDEPASGSRRKLLASSHDGGEVALRFLGKVLADRERRRTA
jgi:hypothetical protein